MKTQEAIDLIQTQTAAGKTKEEITEILKSQDKIGNSNPTDEYIAGLFERAQKAPDPKKEEPQIPIDADKSNETPPEKSGDNHEKWRVETDKKGNVVNKVKKLRDVKISDELAEMLNRADATGFGFSIRYIKK